MKKWLDNYGEEANANEGRSSAPKEWMGEGYSNVGRNYSPAWGGQFQEGGSLDRMAPFYQTVFGAAHDYENPKTGKVSPLNSLRATAKGIIKHPDVLFMKRNKLSDPESDPYGVGQYTTSSSFEDKTWTPTDWAGPRKEHPGMDKIKDWIEQKKSQIQENQFRRRTKRNAGKTKCWGANCYENDEMQSAQLGGNVYPVNYVPQAQKGLTFLDTNSPKLPSSYVIPYRTPSSELATSIGGEDGEPAFLIPTFKYGHLLDDPDAEFRKTGEHLGGPFKTWQEADEWERTVRHPYVEKGQDIPTPLRRWGKDFAMGGSIPGSVGFTYARTNSPAPSNGPYAKKTKASAENGMSFYQHGLDWKPKSISKNGEWLDKYIPEAQGGLNIPGVTDFKMPLNRTDAPGLSIQEKQRQDAAALEMQRRNEATAKRQFVGQGKASTPESERSRAIKNKAYAAQNAPYVNIDENANLSQAFPDASMTGELRPGSRAAKTQEGVDDMITALEYAGYAEGLGVLGSAAKKAVAQSMESGLLSKTYKLNPWAIKENPEMFLYRARPVGQDINMNMAAQLRAKQAAGEPLTWYQKNLLNPQTNPELLAREKYYGQWFEKDPNRLDWYMDPATRNFADNDAIEILRTRLPKSEAAKLNISQFPDAKVLSASPETEFILPKGMIESAERFPESSLQQLIQEHKKFNTPNWLRGYKEVPKPTSNFKSEIDWGAWNSEIPTNQALMNEYNTIEQTSKANGTWMKNPDGSVFQGTPEQFVQQQSSHFKNAFGKSKLLNADGSPMILYHGSSKKFDVFDPSKFQLGDAGYSGSGIYTTPSKTTANSYSLSSAKLHQGNTQPTVYELYGQANNPISSEELINQGDLDLFNFHRKSAPVNQQLLNYDAAIHNQQRGVQRVRPWNDAWEIVFPKNTQVKSAVGNNGMFDMTNPNIYKALVPAVIGAAALQKQKKGGIIKDDRGQWDHPGEITEIQGNTMVTHGYGDLPLYVVPDVGEPRVVEANTGIHTFPGATKFTEYPITQKGNKKENGGWLSQYK